MAGGQSGSDLASLRGGEYAAMIEAIQEALVFVDTVAGGTPKELERTDSALARRPRMGSVGRP